MGFMSPPKPKVPKVTPPPTKDDTIVEEEARRRAAERRGFSASLITGEGGIPSAKLSSRAILGG